MLPFLLVIVPYSGIFNSFRQINKKAIYIYIYISKAQACGTSNQKQLSSHNCG